MNKEKKLTKVKQWIEDHPWEVGYATASVVTAITAAIISGYFDRAYFQVKKTSPMGKILASVNKGDVYWTMNAEELLDAGLTDIVHEDGSTIKHAGMILLGRKIKK